jgi:putative transposase
LLDEGLYYGSVRTMYPAAGFPGALTGERRNQRIHPVYTKPELLAWRRASKPLKYAAEIRLKL